MRTFYTFLLQIGLMASLAAQTPLKQIENKPYVALQPIQVAHSPSAISGSNRLGATWSPGNIQCINGNHELVSSAKVSPSGSFWIDMKRNELWASRSTVKELLESILPVKAQSEPWSMDWNTISEKTDQQGIQHIRVQQTLAGTPILRQDMILHINHNKYI